MDAAVNRLTRRQATRQRAARGETSGARRRGDGGRTDGAVKSSETPEKIKEVIH
jgi:hypothetical protein